MEGGGGQPHARPRRFPGKEPCNNLPIGGGLIRELAFRIRLFPATGIFPFVLGSKRNKCLIGRHDLD